MRRAVARLSFRNFNHISARNRPTAVEDFTDYRHTDVRPVVFTHRLPPALEGVNLNRVASSITDRSVSEEAAAMAHQAINSSSSAQVPIVPLAEDVHGLPEHLVNYMRAKGHTALTPVQAKALQRIYARHDAAVCAPTGSGKTFAFCLALMARLIREGPPKLKSIIVLTPSDGLCVQIAQWLQEMWLWPDDKRLCLVMNGDTSDSFAYRALVWHTEERDHRPYIIVATPEKLLTFCEARTKVILEKAPRHNFGLSPVFHILDTLVIDEVDEVLVPNDHDAPGNVLLRKHLIHAKYQAPIQRVFVSATLSATTVNHIRRFMRKSLFAHTAAHIFENELLESGAAAAVTGAKPNSSKLRVPEGITHESFSADSIAEQRESIATVLSRDVATAVAQRLAAAESAPAAQATRIAAAPMTPIRCAVIIPMTADVRLVCDEVLGAAWAGATIDTQYLGRVEGRTVARAQAAAMGDMLREEAAAAEENDKEASAAVAPTAEAEGPTDTESLSSLITPPNVTFFVCRSETARGLDINDLTHVFILSVPSSALEFTHFLGRVGRMGRTGSAISICPRGSLRSLNTFCEAAGIKMSLHRRLAAVDV